MGEQTETEIIPVEGKYPAIDVARCVIEYYHKMNRKITNMPLQKLLFFIEKASLKETGESMIKEDFYAWRLGPVIPTVYEAFAIYTSYNLPVPKKTQQSVEISPKDQKFIEGVLNDYIDMPVWSIVEESHKETPWYYFYEIYGQSSKIRRSFMQYIYSKNTTD